MIFQKTNINPKQWKKEGDCVVRAIATASSERWEDTYWSLCLLGKKKCMMPNSKLLYEAYLKQEGWEKHKMPKHSDGTRYTVEELIDELPKKTLIISMANHLTCAKAGTLIDTWNCSHKSVGNYWTKDDMDIVGSLDEISDRVRRVLL